MEPTQLQSDADNEPNSLEGNSGDTPPAGSPAITQLGQQLDSRSPNGPPTAPAQKPPLFKRIWLRFNIYLLLMILLVVACAAVVVVLFLNNRKEGNLQGTIGSQNLSEDTLKQLAGSNVTVGNPKQVLNVESNAIFAGSILVRSNTEIAGSLKVGGDLSLPGIVVSGNSRLGQVQADTVTIGSTATIQGVLTARHGVNVSGDSTFSGNVTVAQLSTGSLQLNGDFILTHHFTAGGPIPGIARGNALGSGGTTSVSGSDTSGSITVNTGSSPAAGCFATINFTKAYANTPHVLVTPIGGGAADLSYYVNRSTTSMSVCTVSPPPTGQTFGFDYIIFD